MTKVEIIALAEKWEAAAQRAETRYQDSGAARHLREKEQADDRTILTDLARSIISDARVYGVDSALAPSAHGKRERQKTKEDKTDAGHQD